MRKSCRSRKNLMQNEYRFAKIGFGTAENDPSNVCCCKELTPFKPCRQKQKSPPGFLIHNPAGAHRSSLPRRGTSRPIRSGSPRAAPATLRSVVIWSTSFSVLRFFSAKNGAKELKNHKILDWCKGKNVKLEKR